jgi:Ca-activated chloride channel family protein
MIDDGKIPAPEMISVEGLLSEHDIPLEGEPTGESELYASASVAWSRRYGREKPEAVVQIGFDIEPFDFKRAPLNLAVVMDVSGSMRGGKIAATRKALTKLVDRLNEKDRLAIVLFNQSAWVLMESAPVTDKEAIRKKIAEIHANGGTSIESGLLAGYHQVAAHLEDEERSPRLRDAVAAAPAAQARVFLMTDAQPNVGMTTAHGFKPMMEGAAAKGIGITAFGVGIDFGQGLAYEIFQIRGANYFYLENDAKIAKVFDEGGEFDYMVTPLAYDVRIDLKPAAGARVTDVLGVPDFTKADDKVEMKIASLFLSKREGGGATMVAMEVSAPDLSDELELARVDLSFVRVGGKERISQSLAAYLPGEVDEAGLEPFYSQPGARKALLLADLAVALKAACRGQKAPTQEDLYWTVKPVPLPGPRPVPLPVVRKGGRPAIMPAPRHRRRPAPGPVPKPRPGGDYEYYPYKVTITKEQAAEAVKGLKGFGDWFAGQIGGVDGVEPELRLLEKIEGALCKVAGLGAPQPREVPQEKQPDVAPPDPDIF